MFDTGVSVLPLLGDREHQEDRLSYAEVRARWREGQRAANIDDYRLVKDGKGSPEQIAKVRAALNNKYSPLYIELGESATWARLMIERKYATPVPAGNALWPAYKNFLTVCDFLRDKRLAGVLSEQEWKMILDASEAEHLNPKNSNPTPSIYAMSVTRMVRAIKKLRPDLTAEVNNLPISRER